jgi:hypothetical protein
MVLGRLITRVHGDAYSLIPPRRLTRIFVTCDVVSLLIQGGAAGMMVRSSLADVGKAVVIVGLVFQIGMFSVFLSITGIFHRRMRRYGTTLSHQVILPWEKTIYLLYTVSALVLIRSLFRVAEFANGYDGYLMSQEWPLYVFDTVPMAIVALLFSAFFPKWLATKSLH